MPTEQELKTLLAELQERHPLKQGEPVILLFGGLGGQASAHLERRTIVIPRSWLKSTEAYFTVIHEYAHFLSEDRVSKVRKVIRRIHNFLAHDKMFKQTETELLTEYGIKMKRWIIYPRAIETPWGNPNLYEFTMWETILAAFGLNVWGMGIALTITRLVGDIPDMVSDFLFFIVLVPLVEMYADGLIQSFISWRYRKTGIRRRA